MAYADGSIYEYQPLFDRFDAVQGFAVEIASGLMATTDVDGDGLDDIISHWHGSVACFSGVDFGLVWEHEVDISLQVQSGAAGHSLGFEDEDLESSPGWWAATVATYCPSRPGELPKFSSSKPSE